MWFGAIGIFVAGGSVAMLWVMTSGTLSLFGTIEPAREHWVLSDVAARIEELYVTDGDSVYKNERLVRLRVPSAELEILDAVSVVASLEREAELSRRRHIQDSTDRERRTIVAATALEEAEAQLAEVLVDFQSGLGQRPSADTVGGTRVRRARAIVARSEAEFRHALAEAPQSLNIDSLFRVSMRSALDRLNAARQRSAGMIVASPADGVVILSPSSRVAGALVAAGERIARILDTSCWIVRANVPEAQLGSVHAGDSVKVRLPAHSDSTPLSGLIADVRMEELQENGEKRLAHRAIVRLSCGDPARRYIGVGMSAEILLVKPSRTKLPFFR